MNTKDNEKQAIELIGEQINEQVLINTKRLGVLIDTVILSEIKKVKERGYAPRAIIIYDNLKKALEDSFSKDENLKDYSIETLYGLKVVSTEIPRDIEVV